LITANLQITKKIHEIITKSTQKSNTHSFTKITNENKALKVIGELNKEIKSSMKFEITLENVTKIASVLHFSFHNIDNKCGINNRETFESFLEDQSHFSRYRSVKSSFLSLLDEERLPLELYDLKDTFFSIKKLTFLLPETLDFDIKYYLLVLMNIEWLFPNILEVVLDNSNKLLHGLIENKSSPYFELLKDHKDIFNLLLLYPYFVTKIENLSNLNIILQDSYQAEIDYVMKNVNKIYFNQFHIFDLLLLTVNLATIDIEFNCLDSFTFERFLWLIHKNNSLRYLKIKFFQTSNNSENFFKARNLTKLCNLLNIELKNLSILTSSFAFESDVGDLKKLNTNNINSAIDDVEYIINSMIGKFEINMEKLFFIFTGKFFLNSLSLDFDFPSVISDKYITVFQKFIFDIFINLNSKGKSLQTIEIKSRSFPFDGRTYNSIKKFVEKFSLRNNTYLINFTFNARLNNIDMGIFMTQNLEYMEIGDLDSLSFGFLIKGLENASGNSCITTLPNLGILKVSLSSLMFNYEKSKQDITTFFKMPKPKRLKRIDFLSRLALLKHEIEIILALIKNDRVIEYNFEFSKRNIFDEDTLKNFNLHYYTLNKAHFYNIINGILGVKGKNKSEQFKNVFVTIFNFIKQRHPKIFSINFV